MLLLLLLLFFRVVVVADLLSSRVLGFHFFVPALFVQQLFPPASVFLFSSSLFSFFLSRLLSLLLCFLVRALDWCFPLFFCAKSSSLHKMEKEPFRIHAKCNGMYRVTVVDTGEYTVHDLKLALEDTHGVPATEAVLIADGGAMPDEARLSDFVVGTSWVVLIRRPPVAEADAQEREQQDEEHEAGGPADYGYDKGVEVVPHLAQSAPVTPGGTLKATLPFFYRGDVKNLSIKATDSIGSVLENVVAPAFGVESPDRLGLYVECCLLSRDSLVEESIQLLRSCAVIPVVNDLVTTRVRDQNMPADAFRTDCDACMTTGVDGKLRSVYEAPVQITSGRNNESFLRSSEGSCLPFCFVRRPFCSKCNEGCIVDVKPSFLDIRQHQTRFPWRFLESLTGTCLNGECNGFEVRVVLPLFCFRVSHVATLLTDVTLSASRLFCEMQTVVEVYFNCVCSSTHDDGSACNALLASYKGGRVEVLLEELYRNQYFVRVDQNALVVAATEEKLDAEDLAH